MTLKGAHGTADCSNKSGTGQHSRMACSTQPAARTAAPTLCSRHLPFYDTKLHPPYYCHNNSFKIPLGDDWSVVYSELFSSCWKMPCGNTADALLWAPSWMAIGGTRTYWQVNAYKLSHWKENANQIYFLKKVKIKGKMLASKVLGWPKSSFGFFWNILWQNTNELFGQPNRIEEKKLEKIEPEKTEN